MSEPTPAFEELVRRMEPGARLLRTWKPQGTASESVTGLEIELPDGDTRRLLARRCQGYDRGRWELTGGDELILLGHLRSSGIPVPEPYYADDPATAGSVFTVVGYLDGETIDQPDDTVEFVRQMAVVLTKIHSVERLAGSLPFLRDQQDVFSRRLQKVRSAPDEALSETRIRSSLQGVEPPLQRNPTVILHGDFWPGNTLWRDGRLAGVIDWEDAARGDPLADFANGRLEIFMLLGADALKAFTQQYRSLMPCLDYRDLAYWEHWAALRPAGKMSEWGLDPAVLARFRERHRLFTNQAIRRLQGGG